MNTCRFCSAYHDRKMVKYGTRHYAHQECYIIAGKRITDLHDWQIVLFPYKLLKEHGLLKEAEDALARLEIARLVDAIPKPQPQNDAA